jgi:uncharacterized protein YjbI with pentapeptide repeats
MRWIKITKYQYLTLKTVTETTNGQNKKWVELEISSGLNKGKTSVLPIKHFLETVTLFITNLEESFLHIKNVSFQNDILSSSDFKTSFLKGKKNP